MHNYRDNGYLKKSRDTKGYILVRVSGQNGQPQPFLFAGNDRAKTCFKNGHGAE